MGRKKEPADEKLKQAVALYERLGPLSEKLLTFYFMRHGQKVQAGADPALAEEGFNQVRRSAERNLKGLVFDTLYCSDKIRTSETAMTVISAINHPTTTVHGLECFGYTGAPDNERYEELMAALKKRTRSRRPKVEDWRKVAPHNFAWLKCRLTAGIMMAAGMTIDVNPQQGEYKIFVATHSPFGELLVRDQAKTPLLREADIIKYQIHFINGGFIHLLGEEYIPRGF